MCSAASYTVLRSFWRATQSPTVSTPLQTFVSSAKEELEVPSEIPEHMLTMWTKNSTGPSTVPWGTPEVTGLREDNAPSTPTNCILFFGSRNDAIYSPAFPFTPQFLRV